MKYTKDFKSDYHWNMLNESNSSYIFLTELTRTLVNSPHFYFIFENC